ncbi:MAG: sensor histidine kinase [Anaerolineae bacterium]|jgi:signal transduction histidine kinase
MKRASLEPGYMQAFRLFVATRMVFWVIIGPILVVITAAQGPGLTMDEIEAMTIIERLTLPNLTPILVLESFLLILLLLPQVAQRLGEWFLPLTLLVALVPLLIGYYWWPSENPLQNPFVIFFFVMLVLIAWQYRFRYVIAYVLGLTAYQTWIAARWAGLPLSVNLGWLVLQAAMMLIVGYIIVQLVSIQREQRSALAHAYEQQAAANRQLQQYAATLEELTISRERNRLARELHDTLAHSLSAVAVQLEAVRSLWPIDPSRSRTILDEADETVRRGLMEARRALQDLRASPLQDLGLILALEDLAKAAAERSGASLELSLPRQIDASLSSAVEQGVYRIAQEALENVVRHAGASMITVRLDQSDHKLTLIVEDDGQGFIPDSQSSPPTDSPDRLGIQGMQERASLIGGQLEITTQEGQGTTLQLTVLV